MVQLTRERILCYSSNSKSYLNYNKVYYTKVHVILQLPCNFGFWSILKKKSLKNRYFSKHNNNLYDYEYDNTL